MDEVRAGSLTGGLLWDKPIAGLLSVMWGYPHHVGCQLSDKSIVARQFLSIISV
jgi:hypothetical protein